MALVGSQVRKWTHSHNYWKKVRSSPSFIGSHKIMFSASYGKK